MLVLSSFVLILVATVLIVLGLLVSDGINLIYVSIGVSALATVLLVLSKRAPARRARAAAQEAEPTPAPAPVLVGAGATIADLATTTPPPVPVEPAVAAASAAAADDGSAEAADECGDDAVVEFPIADYDDLTEDEALGLLPLLYSEELDVVEDRERQGRSRAAVLDRLAELRVTGTDADREYDEDAVDDDGGPDGLPIPGYDDLVVREVIAAMAGLGAAELAEIRAHEAGTKNRRTILAAIDRRVPSAEQAPADE